MSWANLDDRLHAHPKIRRLQRVPFAGAEAFGIWTWCLSWCRAYSRESGRVCVETVALDWNADPEHMAEVFALLLSVHLVDETDDPDAFTIHDWTDWQMDQHQRAGIARAASAERGAHGRFTSALVPLVDAGESAGHQRATPLHTTPRLSRAPARDDGDQRSLEEHGVKHPAKIVAADFRPVPKR
uniref:Uncharacterized protein n=1 Tax=viral metagenome TaxID=1070528 RepID=A0A6M3ISD4_9ZZZZ